MLKVYLDESGTHDNSPIVTVSAVFAKPSVWKKWTKDWNQAKGPINVFHAVDCHNQSGEFSQMSREARINLTKKILPIIPKYDIGLSLSGIDRQQLNKALRNRTDVLRWFGHPYLACLHWLIPNVCKKARIDGHEKVKFFHEENQFQKLALETYDYVKDKSQTVKQMNTSFSFVTKKDITPLQCADVVAYEGYKQMKQAAGGIRKPILSFDPDEKLMFCGFWKDEADELATDLIKHHDRLVREGKLPQKQNNQT